MKVVLPRLLVGPPPESLQPALSDWFRGEAGRRVLDAERTLLDQLLPRCFGFHAAQVGAVVPERLLDSLPIHHKILAGAGCKVSGLSHVPSLAAELPFANDSLDLVLLHHTLDVDPNPHATLREACRVLIPEGNLLVVGFNPWSLWGLLRMFRPPWRAQPWLQRPVSPYRLADWMALLDFEVLGLETTYYLPPFDGVRTASHFAWLSWLGERYWGQAGAIYVIQARKRRSCITPVRERHRGLRQELSPVFVVDSREPLRLNGKDDGEA